MLIFNFHHVEPIPAPPKPGTHFRHSRYGLRQVIRSLRMLGYEPACLKEICKRPALLENSNNRVLLTFDDGYTNFLEYAVPVLEAEQCPGTVFVLPGEFSGGNHWDQGELLPKDRDSLMSKAQIQSLKQFSMVSVGSHGMHHRPLDTLSPDDLIYELNDSYQILSRLLGNTFVPVLAYPWGRYSPAVLNTMPNTHYQYAVTTEKGCWQPNTGPFEVPRYSIYFRDGHMPVFLLKLLRNRLLLPPKQPLSC